MERNLEEEKRLFGELCEKAFLDRAEADIKMIDESGESFELSGCERIRMNRLFRELVGSEYLPYPETDNAFERFRSAFRVRLNIPYSPKRRRST